MKKYVVGLNEEERGQLGQLTSKDTTGAHKLRRTQILLSADEGCTDKQIAAVLGSAVTTIQRIRRRFVEEDLEAVLSDSSWIGGALRRRLDGARRHACWSWPQAIHQRAKGSGVGGF